MKIINLIAALTFSLSATTALAADGVGEALAVVDAASAAGAVGDRTLAVGSRVFIGDLVKTDTIGEAQLLFSDGTRMVVGSNSSLVIDEFLFRGNATENKFAVRALGGAFRFISGDSGDDGYSIRTPTATIGVRGTAFDFTVSPSGETELVLLHGAATLCGDGGDCALVASPCDLLRANAGKKVHEIAVENGRVQETRRNFPFLNSQVGLLDNFRVDGHGCTSDAAGTTTGFDPVAAVSPAPGPAPEPDPGPAPEPDPEPARGNNGLGNGGEPSQGEDTGVGSDPSNPGKGGAGTSSASGGPSDSGGNNGRGNGNGGGNGNGKA